MLVRIFISVFIFLSQFGNIGNASILNDYESCKLFDFGQVEIVCDPHNILANSTKVKLTAILKELQMGVRCKCDTGCYRRNGNDRYIGLLIASTTEIHNESLRFLNDSMNHIYYDANLGNEHCDNGLLIVYLNDTAQLAIYQGSNRYILLSPDDLRKLHDLKYKGIDDSTKIHHLLLNAGIPISLNMHRMELWAPIVGLLFALLIILSILSLLLVLFLARFCCCCARPLKDRYKLSPNTKYKVMEPLFISTMPLSEAMYGYHIDAIYSTPCSGTPLPPSHLSAARPEIYPSPMRSASESQVATPTTLKKYQIHPRKFQVTHGHSPYDIPAMHSGQETVKLDESPQTSGISSRAREKTKKTELQPAWNQAPRSTPVTPHQSSTQPPTVYTESDLSFLDPRRKLDTQTRTDFIY